MTLFGESVALNCFQGIHMIDTRRTRQMTKMAVFEKREAGDYERIARHDKKNFVGLWTAAYAILSCLVGAFYVAVAWFVILALNPEGASVLTWILFGVIATVGFVMHTYFYVRFGRRRVTARYDESRKKSDYIEEQYKILEEMYDERT